MPDARGPRSPLVPLVLAALLVLAAATLALRARARPAAPASVAASAPGAGEAAHPPGSPPALAVPAAAPAVAALVASPSDTVDAPVAPEAIAAGATESAFELAPEEVNLAALGALERAEAADPGDARLARRLTVTLAALGEKLGGEGRREEALAYLGRALQRDPGLDRARLVAAAIHLDSGRTREARSALAAVGPKGMATAPYHRLLGELAYAEGDLVTALAELKAARLLAGNAALDERVTRIQREVDAAGNARALSSRHFAVVFDGRENQTAARLVLGALERAYDELKREFRLEDFTVTAILYSERSYREVIGAPDWSSGLYDGKIRLPTGGLETLDEDFRRTLKHELCHAFVTRKGGRGVPRWLHEGLAQYYEGRRLEPQQMASAARSTAADPAEPGDVRLFYAQALLRAEYLFTHHRPDQVMAILDRLAQGSPIETALASTLGVAWPRWLQDYRRWVDPGA